LSWSALPGLIYQLQFKASLDRPAWTDLASLTATNSNATASDPVAPGGPQRFYRVVLPEQ
jgi:hypothetical protein